MIQTLKLNCFCIHAPQHTLVLALSSAFLFCTAPCKGFERAEPLWVSRLLGYQHVSLCPPVQPSLKLFWKRCFSTESTDFTPPAVLWSQSLRSSSYCIFNSSLMCAVKCKIQVSAKASFKPRSTFCCFVFPLFCCYFCSHGLLFCYFCLWKTLLLGTGSGIKTRTNKLHPWRCYMKRNRIQHVFIIFRSGKPSDHTN